MFLPLSEQSLRDAEPGLSPALSPLLSLSSQAQKAPVQQSPSPQHHPQDPHRKPAPGSQLWLVAFEGHKDICKHAGSALPLFSVPSSAAQPQTHGFLLPSATFFFVIINHPVPGYLLAHYLLFLSNSCLNTMLCSLPLVFQPKPKY